MEIVRLKGTDKRLYNLVAPLVMDINVLKQNNGYPFKTSEVHTWYVAIDSTGKTIGFMPYTLKGSKKIYIDNYYIQDDKTVIVDILLSQLTDDLCREYIITALVHKRHIELFKHNHFIPIKNWKNYETMEYIPSKSKDTLP